MKMLPVPATAFGDVRLSPLRDLIKAMSEGGEVERARGSGGSMCSESR